MRGVRVGRTTLLDNLLDGQIVFDLRFGLQAQQLEKLVLQDDEDELFRVERLDGLQRLDEVNDVIPLPVQDQLS